MNLNYVVSIENPQNHYVKVEINATKKADENELTFFLPSWSPGSYLMREYGQHVRRFVAQTSNGEVIYFKQIDKGQWQLDWSKSELKKPLDDFSVSYEVFCHELTVRNSHIDDSHAFLHGPTYLMGVVGCEMKNPKIELKFPALWSKVATGLKDISSSREKFEYTASDYDELIDAPFEIGCHDSDGFKFGDKDHHISFYGDLLPNKENVKADMKTIVETVAKTFDNDLPYTDYHFITHMVPGKFGGLEHLNSTALQFCPMKFNERDGYVNWLALVAHEYFHTWNVKRIRPEGLGPFNYLKEEMTPMLWLAEGLTSFMDEVFVYRSGLCSMEEYLKMQTKNLNRYYSTPGRMFHSLEDSSFNSWIKLYRPNENSTNSSISYYLKGGIVFWILNAMFIKKDKNMDELIGLLWKDYKDRPERGVNSEEVYQMIETVGGSEIRNEFEKMIQTTEEIDIESYFNATGFKFEWDDEGKPFLGANLRYEGTRAFISSVELDGPAFKSGLNSGDEIIAINGMRITKSNGLDDLKWIQLNTSYKFTLSRLNKLINVDVVFEKAKKKIKSIQVEDESLAHATLKA